MNFVAAFFWMAYSATSLTPNELPSPANEVVQAAGSEEASSPVGPAFSCLLSAVSIVLSLQIFVAIRYLYPSALPLDKASIDPNPLPAEKFPRRV